MSPAIRRRLPLVLLAFSLAWLCIDAPGPFVREAWFVLVMLGLTFATRSVAWGTAAYGLSLGIGLAAPAMVGVGWLLAHAGLDVSESGFGSWGVVPILEESVKLGAVCLAAWVHRRKTRLAFNPSDWLLAGCAVGAGFAMVENAELVQRNHGVLRDMAIQYGPSWLVPGAWGAAGYVGHAAATGLTAAGVGVSRALERAAAARVVNGAFGRAALAVPFAWVTLEHVLANLRVDTGSDAALILGNGRLTPWLFLIATAFVVYRDYDLARRAMAHSAIMRRRWAAAREALVGSRLPKHRGFAERGQVAIGEIRVRNAAAWVSLERLLAGDQIR